MHHLCTFDNSKAIYVSKVCIKSTDALNFAQMCCAMDQNSGGCQVIAVANPRVWNMLPDPLHLVDNYACFKSLLESCLFD